MSARTVLVIDDSRVARLMVRLFVEKVRPDWTVIEAVTGEDGIATATQSAPDFIFVDINMPGIDGLEAAERIKAACPGAFVTMLTANIQDSARRRAAAIGVGFLAKPIREDDLEAFLAGGGAS